MPSNWDTSGTNSTTEHTLRLALQNLDEDVLVTFPQKDPLTHTQTGEVLTTTWKWWTDGDGVSSTGVQSGGSYGGVSYTAQGHNSFVSSADLANPGAVVTFVSGDADAFFYITSSGENAEDFGSNSDATHAPDSGTQYDADMQQIEWPVP